MVLGFELKVLHWRSRHSFAWAMPQLVIIILFQMELVSLKYIYELYLQIGQ
jgi:hypothetical protein